jgi:hypothetical protein
MGVSMEKEIALKYVPPEGMRQRWDCGERKAEKMFPKRSSYRHAIALMPHRGIWWVEKKVALKSVRPEGIM